MARQRNTGSRREHERKRPAISSANRQLIGFILLLFIFALLCYTTFVMYSEGTLFKPSEENSGIAGNQNNTGMTSVSIVYKNNNVS